MSIADQVHNKISGLVMNQLAFSFGEDLPDVITDRLYDIVSTKFSYEAEIQKVLGHDSPLLGYGNLMALAEEITLEELYNTDHAGNDEIADYIAKFPEEKGKWLYHVMTFYNEK